MTACQVFFEGRVQGVGFRYSVRQIAAGYEIAGSVRNLPDGRVELLAAGDAAEVDAFVQGILESALASFIRNHTLQEVPVPPGLRGFQITE